MSAEASSLRSPSTVQDADAFVSDALSTRRGNALSNKLTSVLSSSYADTEIRDALRIYDARYGAQELAQDIDLKHEAQKKVIEGNARIVDDFSKVAKQLTRVGVLIDSLNATCASIREHVLAAKQETAPMLEEASSLLSQKAETENKQAILSAFTKHFLISDEDLTTLTNSAEPVNARFFEVLDRVKQIHKDCELLLGYENQRMGLELMEQTTRSLNAGYKKLSNWTLREFKGLDLEDPHISGSIRRSLRALSERPALFQNCLDSFAGARQSTVSDAFQKALTDSTMGAARAIDFSTHDPLRYMGDMLAWVHSATVSEMEALEGLFISDADEIERGLHSGRAADPFAMPTEEGDEEDVAFDGYAALNSLISRNMASVAHTLTQRISVTIRSLSDPVEIYKAYNLLSFYHDMFRKLIRHSTNSSSAVKSRDVEENTILSTLTSLQAQTFKHFETATFESLHSTIDDAPNPDLSPPTALSDALTQFAKIAQTRGPNLDSSEFAKLYGTLIKPVLDSCKSLADDLAGQNSGHDSSQLNLSASTIIYKLNYMCLVRDTLTSLATGPTKIDVAAEPLHHATNEITLLRDSLTELLKDSFGISSGIDDLADLLDDLPNAFTDTKRKFHLFQHSGPDQTNQDAELRLENLAAKLDAFLASALMDAQDELGRLVDREISVFVVRTAVGLFCEKFEKTVQRLEDVDEGVEREKLARSMGKGRKAAEEVNGEAEDAEEEDKEMPTLREVYPRTLAEVQALLS